jgi:hypothetical protein
MGSRGNIGQQNDEPETPLLGEMEGLRNRTQFLGAVHAPELVAEFYRKHPGAARHIRVAEFDGLPFRSTIVSGRHYLEGGVDVRGHSVSTPSPSPVPVRRTDASGQFPS